MKNPTLQELMEYVDGTLEPRRYREIENMIVHSKNLKNEAAMLRATRTAVHNERITPSKKFTSEIMNELLPQRQESFWFRVIKNSSNVFAMVMVLSVIGIVLLSTPSTSQQSSSQLNNAIGSISNAYNTTLDFFSTTYTEYTRPIKGVTTSTSGKMVFIGIFIFSLYVILDGVFGKRMMIRK